MSPYAKMNADDIREAIVAGKFYPASAQGIRKQLGSFIETEGVNTDAYACVLPHAGYLYSGKVATQTASQVLIKDTVILLGPNHTGYGKPFSIISSGTWQTPLGDIGIDTGFAASLLGSSKLLKEDRSAHAYEHSLEVELPVLQYFRADFKIVPISIASASLKELRDLGEELSAALTRANKKRSVLIVASSDFSHYEPLEVAREKDSKAIKAILELDEELLFENVKKFDISMCGWAPVAAAICCSKRLGAKKSRLVAYQTSADQTHDETSVVGYAGIIIY